MAGLGDYTYEDMMAAQVRIHLLTLQGMIKERVEMEVGKGLRIDKLLLQLDRKRLLDKGYFKAVVRNKQGVTLLLNGERCDPWDLRKTKVHDGDQLSILSPITGG